MNNLAINEILEEIKQRQEKQSEDLAGIKKLISETGMPSENKQEEYRLIIDRKELPQKVYSLNNYRDFMFNLAMNSNRNVTYIHDTLEKILFKMEAWHRCLKTMNPVKRLVWRMSSIRNYILFFVMLALTMGFIAEYYRACSLANEVKNLSALNQKNENYAIRYRYIKAKGKCTPAMLQYLEEVFKYNRDDEAINRIKAAVSDFEDKEYSMVDKQIRQMEKLQ